VLLADELLASILDAAGCIKRRADRLRRATHDLRKLHWNWRWGFFENLSWNV